ncbi:MAG: hypothetical protein NZU63_13765 [Gemmataceae bacterium]|nr:hypothetical protein [Gemmataceae bacterium]MDW8244260.1 hypothetical protein [Thermogemmata sp.]
MTIPLPDSSGGPDTWVLPAIVAAIELLCYGQLYQELHGSYGNLIQQVRSKGQ